MPFPLLLLPLPPETDALRGGKESLTLHEPACPVQEPCVCPTCPPPAAALPPAAAPDSAVAQTDADAVAKLPAVRRGACRITPGSGVVVCGHAPLNMAVVMPFIAKQRNYLLANLFTWNDARFVPCATASVASKMDLVLYVSRDTTAWAEIQADVTALFAKSKARKCFRDILFKSADVPPEKDVYGSGTLAQLYGIFDAEYLQMPEYDYIMYMEPDTRPVKPNWAEELYLQVASHSPFWVMGSAPRYGAGEMLHINANDAKWIEYLCKSRDAFKAYASFDQSLAQYRKDKKMYEVEHLFVHTETIMNKAANDIELNTFNRKFPDTVLVHGKGIVKALDSVIRTPYSDEETSSGKHVDHDVKDALTASGANACRKYW